MTTMSKQKFVIDTETTSLDTHRCSLLGVSYYNGEGSPCVSSAIEEEQLKDKFIIAHNGKFDAEVLYNTLGIDLSIHWDTQIAENLLHINEPSSLKKTTKRRLSYNQKELIDLYNESAGEKRKTLPLKWWEKVK